MKKQIKYLVCFIIDIYTKISIKINKRIEIKKFKDSRRLKIYSEVKLTEKQKKDIDGLYITNYGSKIPYTWHRHFTAFTGNFDVNYFPELLYAPEFERYMCHYIEYAKVLTDKNMLSIIAAGCGIKMPRTFLSATKGVYRDDKFFIIDKSKAIELLNDIGEVFIKPTTNTSSGTGCFIANFCNGIDVISKKTAKDIINTLGKDCAIQERLKCHESIRKIYPNSVNTFRIITYRWKNEILVMPAIMRIGSGGAFLDNAHAGGLFIAINIDGSLHNKAFTEFKSEFDCHPDTNVIFEGYKIELFPNVINAAIRMHEMIPQIGCCNWDFTINEEGDPVMIEANMNNGEICGSVWMLEMAHGCGPFGEKTKEILQWLRIMSKTPKSKWSKYDFGFMDQQS